MTHKELVLRAEKWLKSKNCGVVFRDPFHGTVTSGEQPDVIGWRSQVSILIECKTSRADFLKDKNKKFRKESSAGMGDWRFYISPPDIIKVEDLPEGWGLLYVTPKQIRQIHGVPGNCNWFRKKPFLGNKIHETQLMYSALRRIVIKGHIDDIYEPFNEQKK